MSTRQLRASLARQTLTSRAQANALQIAVWMFVAQVAALKPTQSPWGLAQVSAEAMMSTLQF